MTAEASVRRGVLLAGTAAVLFSINGTVSKVVLLSGLPPARLTELRSTGAWLGLFLLLLAWRPSSLRITRAEIPRLALYGIVGFALVQWLYFVSIARLPVGIALLLEFTAPVLIALWARFGAKEAVSNSIWLALALSLFGLALVAQVWRGGGGLDPIGVIAALLAACSLAFYFVLGEHSVSLRDPLSLTCWAFFFCSAFWAVVQPWWTLDWSFLAEDVSLLGRYADVEAPVWALLVWVVVLGTIAPFTMVIASLQHLPATVSSIVGMAEPVLAAGVAWFWLGETLTLSQLVGGVIVLVGIGLAQRARYRNPVTAPDVTAA